MPQPIHPTISPPTEQSNTTNPLSIPKLPRGFGSSHDLGCPKGICLWARPPPSQCPSHWSRPALGTDQVLLQASCAYYTNVLATAPASLGPPGKCGGRGPEVRVGRWPTHLLRALWPEPPVRVSTFPGKTLLLWGQGCLLLSLSPGVTAGRKCPQGKTGRGRKNPMLASQTPAIGAPLPPGSSWLHCLTPILIFHPGALDNWKLALESSR